MVSATQPEQSAQHNIGYLYSNHLWLSPNHQPSHSLLFPYRPSSQNTAVSSSLWSSDQASNITLDSWWVLWLLQPQKQCGMPGSTAKNPLLVSAIWSNEQTSFLHSATT